LARTPDAVEFAIWLHDAVYDPQATDNEAKSALWAMEILTESGCSEQTATLVRDLILATRHDGEPDFPDARLLVDVDLAILGQSIKAFDRYEKEIRAEYAWVPEPAYIAARCKILERFLGRPRIYFTDRFESLYATQARLNLARALAQLQTSHASREGDESASEKPGGGLSGDGH
jgi:predicted metal-dependent HD superfamily phosphohydrolase